MDVDVLKIPVDSKGKLQGAAVAEAIDTLHCDHQVIESLLVVATSGTTNLRNN
jgi:hypothetical protein